MVVHRRPVRRPRRARLAVLGTLTTIAALASPSAADAVPGPGGGSFLETDLVSNQPGVAAVTDPNLVNAWGLAESPSSPLWVSDNGTDESTLYSGDVGGSPVSVAPLRVAIPGGAPTGQVYNDTSGFVLPDGAPARFLFAGEAGTLTAWNPQLSPVTSALTVATTPDAVYKGLALLHRPGTPWLLSADFHHGRIDVFDTSFHRVCLRRGSFRDPSIPTGYAPFNVAVLGDRVFVTYARQDADRVDDVAGPGHGFVDVFRADGTLAQRFARRGVLDSPWGLTIAPAMFGRFSHDVLVGNFGDGLIHAFDPWRGQLLGVLRDQQGTAIRIDGLWGLLPGNGTASDASAVWFSAGPHDEADGLLGTIRSTAGG